MSWSWNRRRSDRVVIGLLAAVALLVPVGWLWASSLVPDSYSVMGMGHAELGGGPEGGHSAHALGWDGPPPNPGDVAVTGLKPQQLHELNYVRRRLPGRHPLRSRAGPTRRLR